MTILGIETSCDETAAAVVQDGTKIISNIVASSQILHAKFGGIIPDKAAREQLISIVPVIKEATESLNPVRDLDAIAVTIGPGLIGSLLVGVETAKALAFAWNKPIVPINHLVGHIYGNWLEPRTQNLEPNFPALVLLVSGGHTELILMTGHNKFKLLGSTRDDAAGECFDKCARILDLGYPGGPAIEKAALATQGLGKAKPLPRPIINNKNFDFSFSGLKTAVLYRKNENSNLLAHELQEAISDVLVKKTLIAAEKYQPKSIIVCGGVAANLLLREKMKSSIAHCPLFIPPIQLCTDNAAYIASAAFFNFKPIPWSKINVDLGAKI